MRVKKSNTNKKSENSKEKIEALQKYKFGKTKRFTIPSNMNIITPELTKDDIVQDMPSSSINDMNRSNLRNINYIENFVIDSNDNKIYKNISYVSFDSNQELSIKKRKFKTKKTPKLYIIEYNVLQ